MSLWNQVAHRRNHHQDQSQSLAVEACEQRTLLSGCPMITIVLDEQFNCLREVNRSCDPNKPDRQNQKRVEQMRLADVTERNLTVENLQPNVFYDASVLYFKVPDNGRPLSLHVRVDRGNVEIMDRYCRRVLASQSAATVKQVIIVDRDDQQDRILIDGTVKKNAFSVSVTKAGNCIATESTEVEERSRGGSRNDWISAGGSELNVSINIYGGHGNDRIQEDDRNPADNALTHHNGIKEKEERSRTSRSQMPSSKMFAQFEQLGTAVLKNLFQQV